MNSSGLAIFPLLTNTKISDQLRECIQYFYCSLQTEQYYVYWVLMFIRPHGLPHPYSMEASEVKQFLSLLATEHKVFAATHE